MKGSEKEELVKCGTFLDMSFGGRIRRWRLECREGLREISRRTGIDSGNYSKLEQGILPPPNSWKGCLDLFLKLGIPEVMWHDLANLAHQFHAGKLHERFSTHKNETFNHTCKGEVE